MLKRLLLVGLAAALNLASIISAVAVPEDFQLKRQTDPTLYTCRGCVLTSVAKHDYTVKDARKCFKHLAADIVEQSQLRCKNRCFGHRTPTYTLDDNRSSQRVELPGSRFQYRKLVDFANLDIDLQGREDFDRQNWLCNNGLVASLQCTGCRH